MLRTLNAPPPTGSIRESVLLLALLQEETIEHAKFRAQAQLQLDEKGGVEAFEDYMQVAFPYLEGMKKKDHQEAIRVLNEEVRKGPLGVTPTGPVRVKSRMRTRRVDKSRSAQELGELYERLKERRERYYDGDDDG